MTLNLTESLEMPTNETKEFPLISTADIVSSKIVLTTTTLNLLMIVTIDQGTIRPHGKREVNMDSVEGVVVVEEHSTIRATASESLIKSITVTNFHNSIVTKLT
jgi:hypothetical protein